MTFERLAVYAKEHRAKSAPTPALRSARIDWLMLTDGERTRILDHYYSGLPHADLNDREATYVRRHGTGGR